MTEIAHQDNNNAANGGDEENARGEKAFRFAFLAGLISIAFVAGAVLTAAETFPGSRIAGAYQAGKALYQRLTGYKDVYLTDQWYPERRPDRGVTAYLPARAQQGLTLYTSGHDTSALLISMTGEIVHEWRRPFSTVWHEGAAVKKPTADPFVYLRKAMLYPNGDLLALYEGTGDTPYGYGIAKLDWNANVIWSYLGEHTHHDMDIGPDGRIYVLTQEITEEPIRLYDNLANPRIDDAILVLSPEGGVLKKIPLTKLVEDSRFNHLIATVSWYAIGDPLHSNGIDVITEQMAAHFPFGRPGQVLLSFRELGAIGVVDLESEKLVWATRGPWIGQHDPDILPSGHILLFDNYGNYAGPEATSRVIEFDPSTMEIVWQYPGSGDRPLGSKIRANQQRLPNGNTLITESSGGRIVEVTPDGDIAWEFVNPIRGGSEKSGVRIPIISWAERVDAAYLDASLLPPNGLQRSAMEGTQ